MNQNTTGTTPTQRRVHRAVGSKCIIYPYPYLYPYPYPYPYPYSYIITIFKLFIANDNKIIIYGGCNVDYSVLYSDIIVLDTTTLQWTAPTPQGPSPPGMYAHTMTMVGTNVIVAFGSKQNRILLLLFFFFNKKFKKKLINFLIHFFINTKLLGFSNVRVSFI